jgi:hemerythrin-like metal-binding protein
MTFASWEPRFSVGVTELDAQHKNLFDLINDYYDCISRGLAREAVAKVIDALAQYSRYHFSYEEKLMRKYGYTEVETQVAEHQKFIDAVVDFQARYSAGTLLTPVEVSNFLKSWITGHILVSDMRYADCFRKSGVA